MGTIGNAHARESRNVWFEDDGCIFRTEGTSRRLQHVPAGHSWTSGTFRADAWIKSCSSEQQTLLYKQWRLDQRYAPRPQWLMHDTTRRWIVSANTGRIIEHVHNIKRKNRGDRLRRLANSNQIRAESGERTQSPHWPLALHHRASRRCGATRSQGRSTWRVRHKLKVDRLISR